MFHMRSNSRCDLGEGYRKKKKGKISDTKVKREFPVAALIMKHNIPDKFESQIKF